MGSYLEAYIYPTSGEELKQDVESGLLSEALFHRSMADEPHELRPMTSVMDYSARFNGTEELWELFDTLYKDPRYADVKYVDDSNREATLNRIAERIQQDIQNVMHFIEVGNETAEFFAEAYKTIKAHKSTLILTMG